MGYSTNRLVVSCCCLSEEVYSRFHATKLLGEHSLSALSPLFKSLHRIWESIGQEAPRGGPRLLPSDPLPLVWMHIWCYVHLVEICWHTIIQAFFQRNKNNNNKKENSCIEWRISEGRSLKFAVRSPGVAFFFFFLTFFFILLLPGLLLFSYNIMLFHLTLPLRKGMQMQIGPIVFNCMHWRVAAQLKCFKCLCLKHRGSWHLRWGEPVSPGSTPFKQAYTR